MMLKRVKNCGLGPDVKNFLTLNIYIFLTNQTKKIYNRAKKLNCDSLLLTYPKKMETEKWPKAADSLLAYCYLSCFTKERNDWRKRR